MINSIFLEGNAVKDVETRTSSVGKQSARFRLAQSQGDRTLFLDVYCYDKTAEIASKIIQKGSRVYVTGRLIDDSFENKEGRKVNHTALIANAIACPQLKKIDEDDTIDAGLPF